MPEVGSPNKPGSSNFVASTGVAILMGLIVVDNETSAVLEELHKHIPGARLVELSGDEHFPSLELKRSRCWKRSSAFSRRPW